MNYNYRIISRQAEPRNGATLDVARGYSGKGGGVALGGDSFKGYWTLITTAADGTPLEESDYYIITQYHAASEGGVSAYGHNPNSEPGNGNGGGTGGGGLNDFEISGNGNAITDASYDAATGALTLSKGETFATLAQLNSHANNATLHPQFTNKTVLDGITATLVNNWNAAYSTIQTVQTSLNSHLNDTTVHITSTERTNWNTAYNQSHTHSNKSLLDVIDQNLSTSGNPTFASYVQIGSLRLTYDSTNNAIKVSTSSGGTAHLYATGGVSAYGYGGGSGGGTADGNNYLSGVSGSGNGTVTFSRSGLSSLTWDASHSHTLSRSTSGSGNVVTDVTLNGMGFTVYYGTVSSGGGTADGNNYLSGVSGSGNGTVTFSRSGLSSLTWDASHSHTLSRSTSGSGNVVTDVTLNGMGFTVYYGSATASSSGPVTSIQQRLNSGGTLNGTWGSSDSCVIRTGFLSDGSGTVADGSWADYGSSVNYSVTSSNCLGLSHGLQGSGNLAGITVAWRWVSGGLRFSVHNNSGASLSLANVSISYVAICSS
jgi:hypothetical protein